MRLRLGLAVAACALASLPVFGWAQTERQQVEEKNAPGPAAAYSYSYLGIGVQEVTQERAKALSLKEVRGAEVTSVAENSPAAKAGLKEGDVVLEYNGQAVQGAEQLARMVRETPADRQVRIVLWRGGSTQTVTATVGVRAEPQKLTILRRGLPGEMPNVMPSMPNLPQFNIPQFDIPRFQMNWQNRILGIVGEALGPQEQLADFFGVKDGVLVKSVLRNSAAEKAGIHAGDVITKVGDSKVTTTDEIGKALRDMQSKSTFPVTVVRNKKETSLSVMIENTTRGMRLQPAGFSV